MAERLKEKIIEKEKMVDVVCGPDAYRDLPRLLAINSNGHQAGRFDIAKLSKTENESNLFTSFIEKY